VGVLGKIVEYGYKAGVKASEFVSKIDPNDVSNQAFVQDIAKQILEAVKEACL
jgi:hypothetical protein